MDERNLPKCSACVMDEANQYPPAFPLSSALKFMLGPGECHFRRPSSCVVVCYRSAGQQPRH